MQHADFLKQLANASGSALMRHFRHLPSVEAKADASPVTIADREAEAAMRALIMQHFPEHGIFGEEGERYLPDAQYQWVLDPIDGTRPFIAGYPTFTTLIALAEHGVPLIGAIHQPVLGELWIGGTGKTSTLNGAPIHVRNCEGLGKAIIATTSMPYFSDDEVVLFEEVCACAAQTIAGGDAYAYAMLATGQLDAVIDAQLKPYDFAALVPVIEGAGGIITDWAGNRPTLGSDGRIIAAASTALHAEILGMLR